VKISTGHAESKFGIPWSRAREAYGLAAKLKNVEIAGVDVHIGSQITVLAPFEAAFARVVEFVGQLRRDGHTSPASIWAADWRCRTAPTTRRRRNRSLMAPWWPGSRRTSTCD